MVKCPGCGLDVEKPSKTWRYGVFTVEAYTCEGCGLRVQRILQRWETCLHVEA